MGPAPRPGAAAQTATIDLSGVPAAAEYRTEPPQGPGFIGSDAAVLNRGLARINAALGTDLRPDPRLARLARWIYEHPGPERALPSQATMDVLTHRLGLPEPNVHLLLSMAPDAPRAANVVSSRLARLFKIRDYTHIGGVAEREAGGLVVIVALSRRPIWLRPVARRIAAPGHLWLEGRLDGPYSRPELAQTLPDGRTTTQALSQSRQFGTFISLPTRGRHRLEIVAQGPEGPTVILNFPVYVDIAVESAAEAAPPPRDRAADPGEVRDALFGLINADRAKAGLKALATDPELDDFALRHSEDMRDHGFVAHVSPTSGSTEERLARAGIVTGLAAENVAKGYGADEVHRGFMDSPGHRGAVLLAGATHVGIGVASGKEGGLTTYYVTEVFTRRAAALRPDAKTILRSELDGLREPAGSGRLEEDGDLTELAETAAREYLLDPRLSRQDVMDRLTKRIEETYRKRGSLKVVFMVVESLEEGAKQAAAAPGADRARSVGIGIAQGTRPGHPPNSIVLVLIFAE